MRLRELGATFVRHESRIGTWRRVVNDDPRETVEVTGPQQLIVFVDDIGDAQGVMFLCPLCFAKNGGAVGTHQVICWFANSGVPDDVEPLPGRWVPSGTGLDDLTFVGPAAASVLLLSGCAWHGFVKGGDAT